ncbi:MAG: lysylphosphatidylglycerol synthase transmembrane domain-containing protein [Planctomycetota bacterium]
MNQTTPNPTSRQAAIEEDKRQPHRSLKKKLIYLLRLFIFITVVIALGATVRNGWSQISESKTGLSQLNFMCLLAALISYLVAMSLSCVFWRIALDALNCHPTWSRTFLAFFASQLGKYVPGKAMVVVIRTDMIRHDSSDLVEAAASVFVETLTWIFVGSVISCILISLRFSDQVSLQLTALGLASIAGLATSPPVFRWLASKTTKRSIELFAGINAKTMLYGWSIMSIAWCFNALSLHLILASFPESNTNAGDFLTALACVSLATVAGFASLLPGGVGVRELVMLPLLTPKYGAAIAIFAAILIRLIWISAELLGSGIIYLWLQYGRGGLNAEP